MSFPDTMTIGEARDALREHVEAGHVCPVCTQFAKVYKRKINSTMARALIALYRAGAPDEFHHGPSLPGDTHEISQLGWWMLVEEELEMRREDGGRAGWWRITELGLQFVRAEVALPKHARVYDHRRLSLTGPEVTIRDALGSRFSFEELMGL